MGFTVAPVVAAALGLVSSVALAGAPFGVPTNGPETATWVATVKIDLKKVGSVALADAVASMTEMVVMDNDDGACLFETAIRGSGHDEKEMAVDVAIKSTAEGRSKCLAAAGDYLQNKMLDFKERSGVKVVSVEREAYD